MADLAATLTDLFSGGDMTIFQAVVDEVGQGVVTLDYNGGTFEDVPFLDYAFPLAPPDFLVQTPAVADQVYVIGRKNWGLLVIGKAAPGPTRGTGAGMTYEWAPWTLATYNVATHAWTVPGTDQLVLQTSDTTGLSSVEGAFFFDPADITGFVDTGAFSSLNFRLRTPDIDFKGLAADTAYMTVGLHANATPAGVYAPVFGSGGAAMTTTFEVYIGHDAFKPLPLTWAAKLISGDAKGLWFSSQDFPPVVGGPGTIEITTL